MRLKRTMVWIGIPVAVLATLVAGFCYFILDWSGRPFCHKQHYLGFQTIEFIRTNARPHWQEIVAEHTRFLESIEHATK